MNKSIRLKTLYPPLSTPVDKDVMIIKEIGTVLSRIKLTLIIRVAYKLFVEYKKTFLLQLSVEIFYIENSGLSKVEVIIRNFLRFFML